jgi:hypothetical protein
MVCRRNRSDNPNSSLVLEVMKNMDIICLTIVCCVAIMAVTTIYCVEINVERKYSDEE